MYCLKCESSKKLGEHHIFPKHYWRLRQTELSKKLFAEYGDKLKRTVPLCMYCHIKITKLIFNVENMFKQEKPLPYSFYQNLFNIWLEEK